jgi:hypothetical protein
MNTFDELPSLEKQAILESILREFAGTESTMQCTRLAAALGRFAITSFEAMRFLDIYHVPARILQLRKQGYEIVTHWRTIETETGAKHRVGLYALQTGVHLETTP